MYKHFLITRFNVREILASRFHTTKNGGQLHTDEWLTERFNLFETYCFPSVKNQTNLNFTWYVFFDTYTPDNFKSKIRQLADEFKNFQPVFIDGAEEFHPTIKHLLNSNTTGQYKFIISSRVDNDDILHKDYIDTIQHLFKPVNNHVINLSLGYQLVIENGRSEIYEFKWNSNPFISLIESVGDVKSVYSKRHDQWGGVAKSITNYMDRRLWMVLIHKNNIYNSRKDYLKAVYKLNSKDFGIEEREIKLQPLLSIWSHNVWSHSIMRQLSSLKRTLKGNYKNTLKVK